MSSYPRRCYLLQEAGLAGQEHGMEISPVPSAHYLHLGGDPFLRFHSINPEDLVQYVF